MSPAPLPTGYYLLNVETVLEDVARRYGDLLHPEETGRLERFRTLDLDARRLCVRMLTRKGPWFREDDLAYAEIPDTPIALETLLESGFCEDGRGALLEDLLPLLTRQDLVRLLEAWGIPFTRTLRRDSLVDLLLEGVPDGSLPDRLVRELRPVRLLHDAWWRLLFFLFFGNGEQDLSSFVLADTGRIPFETYPVDDGARLFESRDDVDFLLSMRECRELLAAAEAPETLAALTETLLAVEPHPGVRQQRRYHRLLADLGREWERREHPAQALACYVPCRLPPARERCVRVLMGQGDAEAAWVLAREMTQAPWDCSEERFLRVALPRLARLVPAATAWLETHPLPPRIPEEPIPARQHPSGSVELAALEAARTRGWDGFFTENVLWNALFGLVFWEELFAPLPGAFLHRFQSAPLDLGSPDFYARREAALEARLREIQEPGALAHRVLDTARRKRGVANTFLHWKHVAPGLLEAAVARVPPAVAASVLATMARNPRAYASGFPDLFLFQPGGDAWKLWEVKGPGDTLRPEQERWIQHFLAQGCEAQVVRVGYGAAPD